MKPTPYFDLNGKRYEIKRTRYLIAEFDKLSKENQMSNETQIEVAKLDDYSKEYESLKFEVEKLKKKYQETYDLEDRKRWKQAKEDLEEAKDIFLNYLATSNVHNKISKSTIDVYEVILVKALEEQYNLSYEEAKKTWEDYVTEIGSETAIEFLSYMADSLFGRDEEKTSPFVEMVRKNKMKR